MSVAQVPLVLVQGYGEQAGASALPRPPQHPSDANDAPLAGHFSTAC